MRRFRPRRFVVPAIALAGSQLGHAVAYFLKFGLGAAGRQSTGIHAYFPTLSGVLSAVVGGCLIAALVVIAASRLLDGVPAGLRRRRTTPVFDVLPTLFVAQLGIFICQEAVETLVASGSLPSLIELLFWAAVGQLPAALLGAVVLSWLSARIETAWTVLLAGAVGIPESLAPALVPTRHAAPAASLTLSFIFPSAFQKRGPPRVLPASVS